MATNIIDAIEALEADKKLVIGKDDAGNKIAHKVTLSPVEVDAEVQDLTYEGGVAGYAGGDIGTAESPMDVTGDVYGSVFGSVYGDVKGNVDGDVTGGIGGSVFGDVKGSIGGNVYGGVEGLILGGVGGDIKGDVKGDIYGTVEGTITSIYASKGSPIESIYGDVSYINGNIEYAEGYIQSVKGDVGQVNGSVGEADAVANFPAISGKSPVYFQIDGQMYYGLCFGEAAK